MFKSESFSKKKEERSPIVQRKNGASLTKRGYDDPVKEKPSPKDFSNSTQKAPIQRYLTIGKDDDDQFTYKKVLSQKTQKMLQKKYDASDEAIEFLNSIATNSEDEWTVSSWAKAVEWAEEKTKVVDALDYLEQPDKLDVDEDDLINKPIEPNYTINSTELIQMPKEKLATRGND